ncbi:MAG: hypothetical protein N2C12_01295, partial [Planctomycetales bacterium]
MTEFFTNNGEIVTYLGIIIFLILTGGGLPIPEEVPIVMAGVMSSPENPGMQPFLSLPLAYVA